MHSIAITRNNLIDNDEIWNLDKLKKTLSCSGIGIWSYNAISKIFSICKEVEGITDGLIKGVPTLRNVLKIVSSTHIRKSFHAFRSCAENQGSLDLEIPISNQKWIILKGTYNPDSYQFQGMVSDISLRKFSEQSVSTLIAKLGHELRSPLTTIRLYTQQSINIAQNVDTEIVPLLEMADRQISRISTLVDDFMLVSTIDRNTVVLRKTKFFVRDLLNEIVNEYFPGTDRKRIVLRTNGGHVAFADRGKIVQVLNNYIGNALKYSPENSRVIISSRKRKGNITIMVQDFGIGINIQDQDYIFQKYYRSKDACSTNGYGIGLFVAREIIEAHNGTFGVQSEIGKGSIFHFSIPVAN